ncbi:hypothetical protein BJV74DRAFT_189666 [Russula compacta]|nr:hypothetical protein BJV74DRAFT_189666 [Russula compacta]
MDTLKQEVPFASFYFRADTPSCASLSSLGSRPFPKLSPRSQHQYCLMNNKGKGKGRPWLSLFVSSRSPKPEHLPMFIGKDSISGTIELELLKPETIREAKVTLKAEKIHSQESCPFLEISQTLIKHPQGKLSGKYSYPFSFVLPDDVTIDESNWAMVYPLPPSLQEKGIVYIDYKILVTVSRGLFSVDYFLGTNIVYLPETIAERPSSLRDLAYLNEGPVPPPTLDPSGWKLLPPVEAVDNLVPNTTLTAQLSIANPVSFALGTPIPLFIDLRSTEAARFDPHSIDVRLVRTLTTRSVTGVVQSLDIARAAFWPAPGSSPHGMKLWGEVIASKRLTPSFNFSKCSVRYSIVLYPRHSPEQVKPQPLLEEEVLLTLRNAAGVEPRSQAPPGVIPAQIECQRSMPPRLFAAQYKYRPK